MADKVNTDKIAGVLSEYLATSISKMNRNLEASNAINSNSLSQSIGANLSNGVVVDGSEVSLTISLNDYYPFVDEGVRGVGGESITGKQLVNQNNTSSFRYKTKKPPFKDILQWVRTKTNVDPNFSDVQRAFIIQDSIFRKGTKATNFYSDVINNKSLGKLVADLTAATASTVQLGIEGIAKEANK